MKKTILKGLITVLALGGATFAYAETASSTPPRPLQKLKDARMEAKNEFKDVRQDAKMEIKDIRGKLASTTKEMKDEIKDKVKDNIKNRIENRYEKMLVRFQATIDRENAIMVKINSRIAKIKTEGGNTSDAEKSVSDAKILLDKAVVDLAALKTLSDTQATMENASTTLKDLRNGRDAMRKAGAVVE